MKPQFEGLHKRMLQELAATANLEDRFKVALEYWRVVKEIFKNQKCRNEFDEPEFFRSIKPLFTSYIEYYLILYQSLIFLPPELDGVAGYWEDECKRYKRYYDKHKDFISYYESYSSEYDREYFTRANNRLETPPQERIFEDTDCRSSHDHIVRGLLANSMYHEYVMQRLQEQFVINKGIK